MVQKIYFADGDIFDKISEILLQNSINETPEDAADKENDSFISIILKLSKDFSAQKISEETFVLELQKKLNIKNQVAKNIIKDVKEKILPLAEKIEEEESSAKINQPDIPSSFVKEKPKMTVEENKKVLEKTREKNTSEDIPVPTHKPKSTGPDSYREPIE